MVPAMLVVCNGKIVQHEKNMRKIRTEFVKIETKAEANLWDSWPLAVRFDSFSHSWIVLLIQHIHHLIVCSSFIEHGKNLV